MLITDWRPGLLERVAQVLSARGDVAVQHRHPGVSTRQFFNEGEALAALCAKHGAPLFINSRLEVALALGAHLHLAVNALPVAEVRSHLPAGRLLSHAVHAPSELQAGADLALVSPVFAPRSKTVATTLGVEGFAAVAAQASCPSFALGGVTAQNAQSLPMAAGFAVMGLPTQELVAW
jgi:thiamine-phosphate pyrophosphorylase